MIKEDDNRTLVHQNNNSWFLPLLALILLAGLVGGGLIGLYAFLGKEPAFSHHTTPPAVVSISTFQHADYGEIGIAELATGPLVSEKKPAVIIAGDWANATWIEVENDRDKLGFKISRPVPGKDGTVVQYFPKKFWALKRG